METLIEKKTWSIDQAHSEIHFKVKHMMVSTVTGSFDEFEGELVSENDDFDNARIAFKALTSSINTKNKDRDNHLRSDDFFNAVSYPELTFESTSFTKVSDDRYDLVGNLKIRETTKEVKLDVIYEGSAVDPYGQQKAGFEITGAVNRIDFGLKWNAVTEAGSIVVSDQIRLSMNIQLQLK